MTGAFAEGGPLPVADPVLLARHERAIAEWRRDRAPRMRVLSVLPDEAGGWLVEVTTEDPAEQTDPGDPSLVRLFVHGIDGRSASVDLPDEVLRRIADRIREL